MYILGCIILQLGFCISLLDYHNRPPIMDEIVPNLWIGDLPSALDVETLKAKKIFSVVTAMRGKVTIHAVCSFP